MGALAAAPLAPLAFHLARDGAGRFAVKGDFAVLELTTRLAASGDVLLGPYSRYRFAHPGPLYFYVLAPLYRATGGSSAAIPLGACLIGALAAFAAVSGARRLGRPQGVAALVCVLAWLAAFGNVCATAWNPMVVVLPLLAYAVLAVAFARGHARAAIPAVFFGALAAETHLACVLSVSGIGAAALASYVGTRRAPRDTELPRARAPIAAAAALLVLLLAPPLLEQLHHGTNGNIAKVARAFVAREEPMKPLASAVRNLFLAGHWLPDRITEATLLREGIIPRVMGWDPVATTASASVVRYAVVHLVAVAAGFFVAARRKDRASLGLLAMGILAEVLAIASLRSALGIEYHYLVFWTSAATTLAWVGALAALGSALAASAPARALLARVRPRSAESDALVLTLLAALACGALQQAWIAHNHPAPQLRPGVEAMYRALRAELASSGAQPVLHLDGAWEVTTALQLELARDGVTAYVHDEERWVLGAKTPLWTTAPKPVHVWAGLPAERPKVAACLRPVAEAPAAGDFPPVALWMNEADAPCEGAAR